MTRENSKIVKERVKKIKMVDLYSDVIKKEEMIPEILKKYDVNSDEIAYIGDDVNDVEIMKKVGLSVTPFDGNFVVMEVGSENDEELEDVHDLNCYPCIYHLL
jgi:3-deoxy-D-manno-octulosonate 8-phosphate phosphatase (KDO 8-P phosphatase)